MSSTAIFHQGVPAGPAIAADPAGPTLTRHPSFVLTRRLTMFQALYADLARAHRRRRQREFQRQLEQRAQQELLQQLPRMLCR